MPHTNVTKIKRPPPIRMNHIPATGNGRLVLDFGFLITAAPLMSLSCVIQSIKKMKIRSPI